MTGVGVVYPTTQLVNAKSRYLIGLKTNSLVPRPESRRFGSDLKPQIFGFYFDLDVKILVLASKEDKILVLVPVSKVRCRLRSLRSASAVLTVVPCLSVCLSVTQLVNGITVPLNDFTIQPTTNVVTHWQQFVDEIEVCGLTACCLYCVPVEARQKLKFI